MPFIEMPDDEEQKRQQEQQAQPLTLADGQTPGAAPAAGGRPPSQDAGKAPGRHVNFQQYFNANRDAAQAMGNRLAAGVDKQGQGVQQGLQAAQTAFNQGVTAQLPAPKPVAPAPRGADPLNPSTGTTVKGPANETPLRFSAATPAQTWQAPTPAAVPTPKPTPGDLAKRAGQTYTGPNSLSEGAGWGDLFQRARGTAAEAAQTKDEAGTQALLQKQAAGPYSQAASRFDAGLTQSAAGDQFERLRSRWGALPQQLKDADAAARAQAGAARGAVAADAADAQRQLDGIKAAKAANEGAMRQRIAGELAEERGWDLDQGAGKAQDWNQYNNTNQFENTVGDFLKFFNPAGLAVEGVSGGQNVNDNVHGRADEWANENFGTSLNSSKLNWGGVTGGDLGKIPPGAQEAIYNSLSGEELRALERMSNGDRMRFVYQRAEALGAKASAILEKYLGADFIAGLQKDGWSQQGIEAEINKRLLAVGMTQQQIDRLRAVAQYAREVVRTPEYEYYVRRNGK